MSHIGKCLSHMLLNLAFASTMILHFNLRQAGGMELGKNDFMRCVVRYDFFSL